MPKLIPSLNGLRALSILCVLIAHIQIMNLKLPDGPGGQVGVTIFFVISGFLITLLLLKEEAATGTISLKNFFYTPVTQNFSRILFFTTGIFCVATIWRITYWYYLLAIVYYLYKVFFVHHGPDDWETGHIWSLSVEEHFYLVWPLVFIYLKKFRNLFAVLIIVAVPLVRLLSNVSVMHLFTRADALMWGCLFAMYYKKIIQVVTSKSVVVLLLPFIGLLLCLLCKKLLPISNVDLKNHIAVAFFGSFGFITNLCIGFIIVISITFQNNIYFAFLNSRPMNYLGKLSYSIYLWQQLFFSDNVMPLSRLPYNLICILIVSIASYYLIEKPFLKLKDRFSKKPVNAIPHVYASSVSKA